MAAFSVFDEDLAGTSRPRSCRRRAALQGQPRGRGRVMREVTRDEVRLSDVVLYNVVLYDSVCCGAV